MTYLSTDTHHSNQGYYKGSKKSVFLAGPTERNSKFGTRWRLEIREALNDIKNLVLFIPEPADLSNNPDIDISSWWPEYDVQIDWEWYHLENCDAVAFWVPRNMETLPGLTTNVEFGLCATSAKCLYGRPDNAEHIRYLDSLWRATDHDGWPICKSIPELCDSIRRKLKI